MVLTLGGEILLKVFAVPTYILPAPSDIFESTRTEIDTIISSLVITVSEAGVGLFIAIGVSFVLAGAALVLPKGFADLLSGVGVAAQSLPLLAISPLLTLWFGHGFWSKCAAATIVCIFPLLSSWLSGFASIKSEKLQFFDNMGASPIQTAKFLFIPLSIPYFFAGLRVAVPLSLIGAIVAEFIGASKGLGFQILHKSSYLKTADMFAYIIATTGTGWLLTLLVGRIERRFLRWRMIDSAG